MSYKDANIRVIPDEQGEGRYATIQWITGEQKMKKAGGVPYTGGLFIKAERCPDDFELPPGFTSGEISFDNGASELGYMGQSAEIVLIRYRRRWALKNGATQYLPWNQYKDGAKSQVQALVAVRGCNIPLTMAFNGKSKGESFKAFIAAVDALLARANEDNVGLRYPRLMFWIPVTSTAALDPVKGFAQAVGKGGQSSLVTPMVIHPALGDLKAVTDHMLEKQYVGEAQLERNQTWYEEAEEWAHSWDRGQALANREAEEQGEDDLF